MGICHNDERWEYDTVTFPPCKNPSSIYRWSFWGKVIVQLVLKLNCAQRFTCYTNLRKSPLKIENQKLSRAQEGDLLHPSRLLRLSLHTHAGGLDNVSWIMCKNVMGKCRFGKLKWDFFISTFVFYFSKSISKSGTKLSQVFQYSLESNLFAKQWCLQWMILMEMMMMTMVLP